MHRPSLLLPLIVLLVGAAAARANTPASRPADADDGAERSLFLAAWQRVRAGQPDLPDPPALVHYSIYPYLVAARLRRNLESAPGPELDRSIDDFLQAHAGQPVSRPLKRAWLSSLAARRQWDLFLARSTDVTEPALVCDRLSARLARNATAGLAADALSRYSLPQRQPPECDAVFDWLKAEGALTPERQEARARAALAADNTSLARELAAGLPAERAQPLLQWLQLLESPKSTLDLLALTPALAVEPEALVAGFTRLAYSDPAAAAVLLPPLLARPELAPAVRTRLKRAAALGAAFSRQPDTVSRFRELEVAATDTVALEWRVRAALWAGDYASALEWIEGMPATLAAQPRWRYWRARAVAATAGAAAAQPLYGELAGMRDFFGYLAADHLKQRYALNMHPSSDDPDVQAALEGEPGVERAHALFDCGLTDDAELEWAAALSGAKPALKVQAARLAARWGWYGQSIATLAQADDWDDVALRYPRPYTAVIDKASELTQVPPDWLLAVMRQESLFRRDAVSRADARGLMQMQPATATAVARRWHWPRPSRDSLFDPEIAVPLGAAYVRELLDRYENQLELTLAAYNAGPVSVARWLPLKYVDADVWIENIPYAETRAYVQHVLEHIVAFAAVRDADPPHLTALLLPVGPVAPAAASPTAAAGGVPVR